MRNISHSSKSLVFVSTNPLQSSFHLKLYILCSVGPLGQSKLSDGFGRHLRQSHVRVRQDASQVVGKASQSGHVSPSIQTDQTHWCGQHMPPVHAVVCMHVRCALYYVTCVHVYVYMHNVCNTVYIRMCVYVYICLRVCVHACVRVHVCVCMYVCMYMYVCVCVSIITLIPP